MEEKILQAILEEIKGLRKDTNNRFESLETELAKLKKVSEDCEKIQTNDLFLLREEWLN